MRTALIISLVAAISACSGNSANDLKKQSAPDVRATSYPAWYLAKRIGGGRLKPTLLLDEGQEPSHFNPTGEQIADLAQADLILVHGNGYEQWLKTATLPASKVVETARDIPMIQTEGPTHSHGKGGEHSHAGVDPRTWTNPENLRIQAKNVHAALVQADPPGKPIYDAQLGAVERNIDACNEQLAPVLAKAKERQLFSAHPSFNYLAKSADLAIEGHDLAADTPPTELAPDHALSTAKPGALLLWDTTPSAAVREALPSVQHVTLHPLDRPHEGSYDYFAQCRLNAHMLDRAIAASAPASDTDATDPEGVETP